MQPLKPSTHLHSFNGGLVLDLHHNESTGKPIKTPPLPNKLILPLRQHQGPLAQLINKVGDYVFKGQIIANSQSYNEVPIHAPTSGNIIDIGQYPIPHPSGLLETCVIIEPDEQERWGERLSYPDFRSLSPQRLIKHIHASGITGMGGAAFPTATKLEGAHSNHIELLLINAAECEPYISCDDSLMRARAEHIIEGINIIQHCLNIKKCIIAIETTLPEAYSALDAAIKSMQTTEDEVTIELVIIPSIYPIGGERQLIKVITGKEVPVNKRPNDIGILCHNVATAYAIYNAVIKAEPLISRIVTVTGKIKDPRNLEVLLGTPIEHLIDFCGGYTEQIEQLTMGGSMMGYALNSDKLPIIKASNCILALSATEMIDTQNPQACIRCGLCEQVCPANLLPQQLYWHSKANDFEKAEEFHLNSCIECGCCTYVCPSHIPLVDYYRYAKSEIKKIKYNTQQAETIKLRFEQRTNRIENENKREQQKLAEKRKLANTPNIKSEIAAALARRKKSSKQ